MKNRLCVSSSAPSIIRSHLNYGDASIVELNPAVLIKAALQKASNSSSY